MSFPSPPVEVLEQLIKDTTKKPEFMIYTPAERCCQKVMNELVELVELFSLMNSEEPAVCVKAINSLLIVLH